MWRDLIGRAIWYAVLIAFVIIAMFVVCECGTLTTYRFVAPGLGGMVSNYDDEMLQSTDALYLLNGYVTETPGVLGRRTAIKDYGVNVTSLYGVTGYYNPWTGGKSIFGVTDNAVDGLGQFVVSDTFGTEVGYDTLSGTIFPHADAYHDFTPYEDVVVCADGYNVPCIFSTSQGFLYTQSKPDTFGYDPHLVSMGLEAPGQPRVGVVHAGDTGNLGGRYIYAFAYIPDSVLGIESRPVTVKNEHIYITNFPMDIGVYLLRKTGQEDNLWYEIYSDTVDTDGFYFIDSVTDTALVVRVVWWKDASDDSLFDTLPSSDLGFYYTDGYDRVCYQCCNEPASWDSIGYRRKLWDFDLKWCCGTDLSMCNHDLGCGSRSFWSLDSVTTDIDSFAIDTSGLVFVPQSTGRAPGQFVYVSGTGKIDTVGYVDSLAMSPPESLYWIAYSYYDQVTGIESPLGPILACSLTEIDTDTVFSRMFAFDNFDLTLNPSNVRTYQTVTKTTLPGASDTMVWYGVLEMRAFDGTVVLGNWNDDSVAVGLDTGYINTNLYYTHQMLRNDVGTGVRVLPPYKYDCRIPFSDIEYMAGQLWGIGDPDYPNRIYFSEYDWPGMNIFSWYPLDFVQIREIGNDELIKIERAEGFGADALYVFANNSIWLLNTSGDYQAISTRVGAASQETVVKHGEDVYFLSPDLRFHVLTGGQIQEISQPIENYVESVFVDWNVYGYRGFYAWAHTFGDYVRWFNDTTGMGLSFNTISQVWTLERYGSGAYVPRVSFSYDTMHSGGASVIFTSDVELLCMDSTVSLRKADPTGFYDAAGSGKTNCLERAIQFAYWTPRLGDGTRYQQIQEFDITLDCSHSGAFHYIIYDEDNDSLCGDSIYLSGVPVHLRIHPPYNNCLRPSLKIYTNDTDSLTTGGGDPRWLQYYHNFKIHDLTVKVRDMGVGSVQ